MTIDLAPQGSADGAASVAHGLTQVQAQVFGPREAKSRAQSLHDRAVINVEITVTPFSTGERRRRGKGDKRTLELATTIKHTFEPVVQTMLYPRSQIDIFILVLQQDGGLLQACINATTLALASAGVPLSDYVCAISAGVYQTQPLLDLSTLEENDVPHATVAVLPRSGALTLVTMETRLHVDRFEALLKVAGEAGQVLHKEMRKHVRAHTLALVDAMGAVPAGGAVRPPGDGHERRYNEDMDEL